MTSHKARVEEFGSMPEAHDCLGIQSWQEAVDHKTVWESQTSTARNLRPLALSQTPTVASYIHKHGTILTMATLLMNAITSCLQQMAVCHTSSAHTQYMQSTQLHLSREKSMTQDSCSMLAVYRLRLRPLRSHTQLPGPLSYKAIVLCLAVALLCFSPFQSRPCSFSPLDRIRWWRSLEGHWWMDQSTREWWTWKSLQARQSAARATLAEHRLK